MISMSPNTSSGLCYQKFKEQGENALWDELKQLHDMDVFIPVPESTLTVDQKSKALSTVTFIKQKWDNWVKGRVCADGCKQCKEFSREEAASLTVTNKSVFITGVIGAKEDRDVATVDITGAYLHAINDHNVHMVLEGKLAELMDLVAPHIYWEHITTNNKGQPLLYVWLHKALYTDYWKAPYSSTENWSVTWPNMVLRSTPMTHAWQTKSSMVINWRCCGT